MFSRPHSKYFDSIKRCTRITKVCKFCKKNNVGI